MLKIWKYNVIRKLSRTSSLGINKTFKGCLVHEPFVDKGLGNLVPLVEAKCGPLYHDVAWYLDYQLSQRAAWSFKFVTKQRCSRNLTGTYACKRSLFYKLVIHVIVILSWSYHRPSRCSWGMSSRLSETTEDPSKATPVWNQWEGCQKAPNTGSLGSA